jgi:hypothetical protein
MRFMPCVNAWREVPESFKKNARHEALQVNASDLLSGYPAAANDRA